MKINLRLVRKRRTERTYVNSLVCKCLTATTITLNVIHQDDSSLTTLYTYYRISAEYWPHDVRWWDRSAQFWQPSCFYHYQDVNTTSMSRCIGYWHHHLLRRNVFVHINSADEKLIWRTVILASYFVVFGWDLPARQPVQCETRSTLKVDRTAN